MAATISRPVSRLRNIAIAIFRIGAHLFCHTFRVFWPVGSCRAVTHRLIRTANEQNSAKMFPIWRQCDRHRPVTHHPSPITNRIHTKSISLFRPIVFIMKIGMNAKCDQFDWWHLDGVGARLSKHQSNQPSDHLLSPDWLADGPSIVTKPWALRHPFPGRPSSLWRHFRLNNFDWPLWIRSRPRRPGRPQSSESIRPLRSSHVESNEIDIKARRRTRNWWALA